MTTFLFWDIDGTLLTTGRAGIFALEEAALEVTGKAIDLTTMKTAGLTDRQIAVEIIRCAGIAPSPDKVDRLLQRYGEQLPASLHRKQGRVLSGVREILDRLRGREDVVSLLLTGNIQAGARAKLAHYGLSGYFSHGAFCDAVEDRVAIARAALAIAAQMHPDGRAPDPQRLFVIGDTPHDITCGHAIHARVVAVASGGYALGELQRHRPWWALESLPEADVFLERLGLSLADPGER